MGFDLKAGEIRSPNTTRWKVPARQRGRGACLFGNMLLSLPATGRGEDKGKVFADHGEREGCEGAASIVRRSASRMSLVAIMLYRLRIWLTHRLLDLAVVVAPAEVRNERNRLRSHRRV